MSHYLEPPNHPPGYRPPDQHPAPDQCGRLSAREGERSSYLKMLTNIANDLDLLLTDLVHMHPCQVPAEGEEGVGLPGMGEHTLNTLTQHSGDTLGKDSFLSSAEAASRRLGDTTGSSQSLVSSSSDNLSADSGHDERTQGTTSPLVFDPTHFGSKPKNLDTTTTATMTITPPMLIAAPGNGSHDNESHSGSDLRPISLVERLAKTHCIWLLTQMSRAGAVHLLKDRETGVFLIRKSSQSMSLALSVQNRLTDRANVDHYLIEASDYGMRLQGSAHFFHSIPSLISHYIENLDELPYRLTLPPAILQARSSRELASLAMLGQDFWLSPVSRKARTPSPACGSLHKSCSEPIDIRQPMQHSTSRPHTPNTPPLHALPPSHSVSDFSDFLTTQQVQEEQAQIFKGQFSNQVDLPPPSHRSPHLPPRRVFASVPTGTSCVKGQGGFGPHLLRLKGYNNTPTSTDSSGEESGGGHVGVPHIHLVGASPQSMCAMSDASSQTDFSSLNRHKPKGKPNLYSMTPVELLHLPENNSYFHSNLSDKMSDYEDIWRSSYYDSDSVRNGSVRGGGGGGGGGYEVGSCTTAQSDFSKFFAVSGNRESTGVRPVPVVVTTNCNTVATQSEESPPIPPKNWRTSIVVDPKHLHPLGRLSRLKSSSDSSLATVSSPVYAEPADAVVFRERQNRSSRAKVRRRSAPSVSSQSIPPEHRPPHTSRQSPFSGAEKLATILSQAALDQAENTHPKKDTFLPKKGRKVDPKQRSGAGMTRSQSMRTAQEVSRLAKNKPAWHERFNRLKLGTKVLSRSGSPYAATTKGAQPQLDDSLFSVEESSSGPSAVNRFPVYQRSKLVQSVNRGSYFSESSTVQDIISCAMPELMVRPIQAQRLVVPAAKTLSEYDNYNPYAPPSASSRGTIFCKPWEGSVVDTLLRTSHTDLPPAMDLQERVQMWQEANQTFHHSQQSQQQQRENPTHQQQLQQHQQHLQQLQMIQQQQRLQQSVVKQAHTVQTVTTVGNAGTVNSTTNVNVSKSSSRMVVQSEVTQTSQTGAHPQGHPQPEGHPHPQGHANLQGHPHPHKSVSPSRPQQARPQSMMVQERHNQHPQLHRSHSNPNQAQQLPLPRNQQGQVHQQHQGQGHQQHLGHHHQQGHHLHQQGHHLHQQGQPVVTEGSSVTPDSRMGGLSSNCPDVINCHHIAVDTGNAALSDDEILIQSVTSTLPNRGQLAAQRKQAARDPGSKIREYIYKLSQDRNTTFGSTIENFIQCTVESQEKTPHHVMRNVRQFMTGIKNYLVKHGEGQLEDLIERERNKLGRNEILNIDALIETTLHMCVLRPLKHHIYRLFVDYHGRNNSLELMSRNIKYARTKTAEEIGIKPGLIPPQAGDMETIKHYLDKMQRAYSPLKKLENLLCATSAIYSCVKVQGKQHLHSRGPASLGADDFLPLLIYVLVHCGLVSAEIEADYMWGLLHPSVLTGEGGYYLTTLSSAVLILKNFQEAHESKTASLEGQLPTLGEVQGFLKIAFPDELRDTILWKTLPVRPNMTTKDVCSMIAHKFKITNPQDYGLILLSNGEESQLSDNQCPQILKKDNIAAGKESFFAYKRLGANIAWPSSMKHS